MNLKFDPDWSFFNRAPGIIIIRAALNKDNFKDVHAIVMFRFSEKATKFDVIFHLD